MINFPVEPRWSWLITNVIWLRKEKIVCLIKNLIYTTFQHFEINLHSKYRYLKFLIFINYFDFKDNFRIFNLLFLHNFFNFYTFEYKNSVKIINSKIILIKPTKTNRTLQKNVILTSKYPFENNLFHTYF